MRKDSGNFEDANAGYQLPDPAFASQQPYSDVAYTQHPSKRSNKLILQFVIFLVVIIIALIVLQSVFFRIQTVYVIGNHSISAEYITALSGLVKGDSIVSVSEESVRKNIEANHWLTLQKLYKQYPSSVFLVVDERKVIAVLQYLGIEYSLDIDGMVLNEYPDMDFAADNIPVVYGFNIGSAAVGELLSVNDKAQLIAYSAIVSELVIQRYADQIKSINVKNTDSLSLQTNFGITVELGNSDFMRAKIGAMRTDIAYLQQLGETSGVLDVTLPEDGKFRRE